MRIVLNLQAKFLLWIILIFTLLAVGITLLSIRYVNRNTIREAENRVRIYARAAWQILDGKMDRVRAATEVLAQDQAVKDLLYAPYDEALYTAVRQRMENIRIREGMDVLTLVKPDGTVLLRTRHPYNAGDSLASDPLVRQVLTMAQPQSRTGYIIFEMERLDVEGSGLIEKCMSVGQVPRGMLAGAAVPVMEDGKLIGVIEMGSLLNGAYEKVDRIRNSVFANEVYKGKPVGTATIFMGDLRISTNVLDSQGRRAVGTYVSPEVAERVLEKGESWTGRALVVDAWYLAQYDPIRDPDGNVIGMLYVGELEQKYLDLRTRAAMQYLSVVLLGLIVASLGFFFMVRGIVKPIRKLSEATHLLAAGDLSHRVEVIGNDEVAELSASFNAMAEQLERQRKELERRQRELEELSNELRIANQNYIDMLGFVAHELKNPLSSAMMSLHTVRDGYLGELNPAQKRSLGTVARSLDYFYDMIKNYLDLSRLESGSFVVEKRPVSLLSDVVKPVLEPLERELEEWQMQVECRIPEDLVLNVDPNLLRIVYDNLLSNALKYGREGGDIVLEAQDGKDKVVLSVRNDSSGIPEDKLPLLFKKFSRLDTPEYAARKGSGLGLYICKEIIERMDGEIWAESKMGEWVKFSFALPKQ
ncbi:MAG: cache domain-containing protein [Anaerolineae bacterium]|nr:cache domain-containing protein [Anaerolineae bacterium]